MSATDSLNAAPANKERKVALITGITGQDGSYLMELLLDKGYSVHGVLRRSSSFNTGRIDHLFSHPNLHLHYGDLTDGTSLNGIISTIRPDEIYNLAAQSHVKVSFEMPEYTAISDAVGVLKILEIIRSNGLEKKTKFYQASTSELYGLVQCIPQDENTPFYPRSPYGVAKLYAYWIVVNYREAYGMFASNGILFNHESPRRGATFVTRKITRAVARIKKGLQEDVALGNVNSKRDWGHAKDYVRAMWMMLQTDAPDDYCVGMGVQYSVREFCELAFKYVGMEIEWKGEGVDEVGLLKGTDRVLIRVDPRYFRPTEVETLLSNPKKANEQLKWKPEYSFEDLVNEMMESEMTALKDESEQDGSQKD